MSEQTTNPQEWLAAGELECRQRIIVKGAGTSTVFTVEHSLPYRSGKDPMVVLTLAPVGGGEPHGVKWSAEYMVRLASEDQVAEAVDAALHRHIVAGLREVTSLIEKHQIRFKSWYGLDITATLPDGEVSRLAELLDVELSDYGREMKQLTWSVRDADVGGDGVTFAVHGKPAPEPQPEPEPVLLDVAAGAELAAKVQAEFDALPAEAEHYHAAGSGGGPGACSAVCACGLTFAGFDTIAEAVKLLDQHIANPESVEVEQEHLFTFGAGQQFDGRFVRIRGTHESARARMNRVFGHAWCDQYTWQSFDAAGLPGKVTELPEAEWPPHADEAKYRITFDLNAGVKPILVPAGTTIDELITPIREAFLAADLIRDGHQVSVTIDGDDDAVVVTSGQIVVSVDGHIVEHGTVAQAGN